MSTFPHIILAASRRSRDLGERLLAGIAPSAFARFPAPAGQVIRTNHPAFIYGHLALYPAKILFICGKNPTAAQPPASFDALFKRETPCLDDPDGAIYPPMAEIAACFLRGYDAAFAALADLPESVLAQPNPDARLAQTFPTVGFCATFLLTSHLAGHLGQVSAWRRCMGLGPV